jgi:hypothetical protein
MLTGATETALGNWDTEGGAAEGTGSEAAAAGAGSDIADTAAFDAGGSAELLAAAVRGRAEDVKVPGLNSGLDGSRAGAATLASERDDSAGGSPILGTLAGASAAASS